LFGLVNALLQQDSRSGGESHDLTIQRYAVVPLSPTAGLISWVPNSDTLHDLIRDYRDNRKIKLNVEHILMQQLAPNNAYNNLTNIQKLEIFEYALMRTEGEDLAKILWLKSDTSEIWLQRRTNYTRSLAVMSMVGYVLGLGDRHPSNLMLDRNSGKVLHIDFGDCFEVAMQREKFPEKVPFRLTRMLVNAMEVSGIEGSFRLTCEKVMTMLRDNRDSLIAVLEAFVHDPLLSWRLLTSNAGKKKNAQAEGSSRNNTTTNPPMTTDNLVITTNHPFAREQLATVSSNLRTNADSLPLSPSNSSYLSGLSAGVVPTQTLQSPTDGTRSGQTLATIDVTVNKDSVNLSSATVANMKVANSPSGLVNSSQVSASPILLATPTMKRKQSKWAQSRSSVSTLETVVESENDHDEVSHEESSQHYSVRDRFDSSERSKESEGDANYRNSIANAVQKLKTAFPSPPITASGHSIAVTGRGELMGSNIYYEMNSISMSMHAEEVASYSFAPRSLRALSQAQADGEGSYMGSSRRRKESHDNEDEICHDRQYALREKAVVVINRVRDKLTGLDFSDNDNVSPNQPALALDVEQQVDKLILQATSNENLCLSFIGWCPFW
jgi:hypothetical protein